MTRPRRRIAWGIGTGFLMVASALVLLGPEGEDWRHVSGAFGERTDSYGALVYLTVSAAPVTPNGVPGPGYAVSWDLRAARLIQTLVCLTAIAGAMSLLYRAGVNRRGPPHLCDECGYELRGIETDRCPECGSGMRPDSTSG